jgi:DNA-binding LytR/AlgR family response regulator
MIRCIVIDDEQIAREGLLEFIREFDFLTCVGDYANPVAAVERVKNKEVDLIFLDIEMPRMKGIQFAELVNNNSTMIVFTTAHPEYALKGYKVNAIDYLLKPIFFDDFKRAVTKARSLYALMYPGNAEEQFIFFREDGVDHRIRIGDIAYVKSLQNYVQLFLVDNRTVMVHKTLKALQESLPAEKFLQIHRSYLVQTKCISAVDGLTVVVQGAVLPVARERKHILLGMKK